MEPLDAVRAKATGAALDHDIISAFVCIIIWFNANAVCFGLILIVHLIKLPFFLSRPRCRTNSLLSSNRVGSNRFLNFLVSLTWLKLQAEIKQRLLKS